MSQEETKNKIQDKVNSFEIFDFKGKADWKVLVKKLINNIKLASRDIKEEKSEYYTLCIIQAAAQLTDKKKFFAFYKRAPQEYLWDLLIAEVHNEEYGGYKKPVLVLETEWGKRASKELNIELIYNDFVKLLEAKSKWKVMNFTIWHHGNNHLKEIKNMIIKTIRGYQQIRPEEEYIFLCWDDGERRLIYFQAKKVQGKTVFSKEKSISYNDVILA